MTEDEALELPIIELDGPAPDFEAVTTHGKIRFHDWKKDQWALLFSHPADFTPVCTTEFVEFARMHDELRQRNVLLLGNSVDSLYSHIAWVRNINERFNVSIEFPIIADLDQRVSLLYGMVHEPFSATETVRSVFFIDPKNTIRAMIHYPLSVGRNMHEMMRVIEALQTVDEKGVFCPANWTPGSDVIVPPPLTTSAAAQRLDETGLNVHDWYLATKKG